MIAKMRMAGTVRGTALGTALAAALGSAAWAAGPAPEKGDQVWAYLNGLPKAERMAAVEREANREGQFTVYGALGIDKFQEMQKLFNLRHPKIKIDFVRLTGDQVPEKIMIEHRSGRVSADGALSTVDYMDLLSDALAPYEPTTWDDYDPRFRAGGYGQGWTAAVFYLTPTSIGWRTDRVGAAEAPRTLDEVMTAKWKGRVGTTKILERFMDALIVGYGEKAAMDKLHKLADLKPQLYGSTAALSKALAVGEIDIAFNLNADRPKELKGQGAPVDFVFQKPLHGSAVTISAVKQAPHPYGAALFVEFLTDVKTSETLDAAEKIRFFGHKNGNFANKLADFPEMIPFGVVPKERFAELNRIAEELFIRK